MKARERASAPQVRRALCAWYRAAARNLPWRHTKDPYRIWLAETMLQQTRVETVLPYYQRFLAALPTVSHLAAAPLEVVLELWQGLGYYGRARHLRHGAQIVVTERGGRFPTTAADWQCLPGIGRYTAGAIASIVHDEVVPAVDGNARRVLARLYGIQTPIDAAQTDARIRQLAAELLPRSAPGDFNQALMDLGARVCTPRQPRCCQCPLRVSCAAAARGLQDQLPRRRPARKPRTQRMAAAAIRHGRRLLIVQRPAGGALAGLWTLPGVELADGEAPHAALRSKLTADLGTPVIVGPLRGSVGHDFSHRRLRVAVYECSLGTGSRLIRCGPTLRWLDPGRQRIPPLAALDRKLLAVALGEDTPTG